MASKRRRLRQANHPERGQAPPADERGTVRLPVQRTLVLRHGSGKLGKMHTVAVSLNRNGLIEMCTHRRPKDVPGLRRRLGGPGRIPKLLKLLRAVEPLGASTAPARCSASADSSG